MSTLQIQTPQVFVPLLQPSRYKGAHGGRGSGKSHFFAEMLVEHALLIPGLRAVCVREVQRSLKESVMRLIVDKITALGLETQFRVMSDSIITPGGGVVLFQGMADHTAESIKSLEGFDIAYVEEAQTFSSRSLEMLRPTIRGSMRMRERNRVSEIWFSWNPRTDSDPVDAFLRGNNPPESAIVVEANWRDNPFFPQELEEERKWDEQFNPVRYGHIWEGEYEPQAVGAIWTRDIIERNRVKKSPELGRILVGVDPPVSSDTGSDECGIQVCGEASQEGYVLEDCSFGQCTPEQWARRAISAYDIWEADAIVAEVNQGGEMVANTIHAIRPDVKVIDVRATRGKHVRAEPIAALYATGRIHHVGNFPQLERQMCLMTAEGYEGEGSPDRLDAMVWAFSKLFGKMTQRKVSHMPQKAQNSYDPHRWRRNAHGR